MSTSALQREAERSVVNAAARDYRLARMADRLAYDDLVELAKDQSAGSEVRLWALGQAKDIRRRHGR